ncbi:unnamed protein product [Lymnaea stagnalis]|uniref:Metalloendopeptidase n=1 Tax=Lymnaea stagnalis TaxID=6523 RepID=A0AAV2I478_LYMST
MERMGLFLRKSAVTVWSVAVILVLLQVDVSGKSVDKYIMDSAPKAEMFDFFHLMPEGELMVMTELDLLMTLNQYKKLYTKSARPKRKAVSDVANLWPACTVYYEITSTIPQEDAHIIEEAIREWTKYTCLEFIKSGTKQKRIQFKDGGGCYSQLGMQGKPQPIVLAPGCRTKGVVVHEIGHAIGWIHEHMRPDRDQYIRVNFDAIPLRFQGNFNKYKTSEVNTHGVPYDYQSIMHYGTDALPDSITTLDPDFQSKIGQRDGFTFKDIKTANLMYNCSANMKCPAIQCPFGGFVYVNKNARSPTCECWCDSDKIDDPLVRCSEIRRPRPEPIPISPPQPPTTQCADVRGDCQRLKTSGRCMTQMDLMMDVCAKTCEFCGKGEGLCMDHEKGCKILAAAGQCQAEGLKDFMTSMCPASCGVCKVPSEPCDIQNELLGPSPRTESGSTSAFVGCLHILILNVVIASDIFI